MLADLQLWIVLLDNFREDCQLVVFVVLVQDLLHLFIAADVVALAQVQVVEVFPVRGRVQDCRALHVGLVRPN